MEKNRRAHVSVKMYVSKLRCIVMWKQNVLKINFSVGVSM